MSSVALLQALCGSSATSSFCPQDNTAGTFDERLYRYGVSGQAQEPRDAESCYRVQL